MMKHLSVALFSLSSIFALSASADQSIKTISTGYSCMQLLHQHTGAYNPSYQDCFYGSFEHEGTTYHLMMYGTDSTQWRGNRRQFSHVFFGESLDHATTYPLVVHNYMSGPGFEFELGEIYFGISENTFKPKNLLSSNLRSLISEIRREAQVTSDLIQKMANYEAGIAATEKLGKTRSQAVAFLGECPVQNTEIEASRARLAEKINQLNSVDKREGQRIFQDMKSLFNH